MGCHVDSITKKLAKRLYISRVLKRNGLPVDDLKTIFKYYNIVAQSGTPASRLTCLIELRKFNEELSDYISVSI